MTTYCAYVLPLGQKKSINEHGTLNSRGCFGFDFEQCELAGLRLVSVFNSANN